MSNAHTGMAEQHLRNLTLYREDACRNNGVLNWCVVSKAREVAAQLIGKQCMQLEIMQLFTWLADSSGEGVWKRGSGGGEKVEPKSGSYRDIAVEKGNRIIQILHMKISLVVMVNACKNSCLGVLTTDYVIVMTSELSWPELGDYTFICSLVWFH